MSGAPRVRSVNVADLETRAVLGPTGNKAGLPSPRKPGSKPLQKPESSPGGVKSPGEVKSPEGKKKANQLSPVTAKASSVLPRHEKLLQSNLSLNASCSSDASTESFRSRASTGRLISPSSATSRRKPSFSKSKSLGSDGSLDSPLSSCPVLKKKCAWVTPNTDSCYAAFHDEEWGVPVHDDKKLFELLVLSGALAELTWPSILSKRQTFREVFADFDPLAVSKLSEKKMALQGSPASALLSEPKLRAIIENARQITKVVEEFGSFDKYIWSFVNNKPIISRFRYPRQVPVKSPKADVISKDLVRRGFRSVGPSVIYSFMQAAGLTNDHLTSCFRFQECISASEGKEDSKNDDGRQTTNADDTSESELSSAMEQLDFSRGSSPSPKFSL
ncbi:hypothetical protein MLD38_014941 [Melastoma candidum]|uniref:Uncharacterized protein n=1 Tax=Melastoma candidum TaxID=119954 RepID=A0ACB9RIM4_9MYRT|nr:hypothetical protein MLD38_014941 [Melastoma candidum]